MHRGLRVACESPCRIRGGTQSLACETSGNLLASLLHQASELVSGATSVDVQFRLAATSDL